MSLFNKNSKRLYLLPVTAGALVFAAFGVVNLVQAWQNPVTANLTDGDSALFSSQDLNALSTGSGACNYLNCAACRGCSFAATALVQESNITQPEILVEAGQSD